jgi:magnesium transporter
MLIFHNTLAKSEIPVGLDVATLPAGVNWVDAFQPTDVEQDFLRRVLGIDPPSRERLSEIENSSRLYTIGDHLYLATPTIYHDTAGLTRTTPLGFVLGKDQVLTIRFKPIKACDHHRYAPPEGDHPLPGGVGGFLSILEQIVDHLADDLEAITSDLENHSHVIFHTDDGGPRRRVNRENRNLRPMLARLGRIGGFTSRISETLLGISRMIPYVVANAGPDLLSPEAKVKLKSVTRDVASLSDYERHVGDKIQFLLDATLGMISVDQNDIFKVLTLVSVVGIPPTLIASMYGMNFKNMPELDWTYGYPYGLTMIVLSALIPLAWFKWRGWW